MQMKVHGNEFFYYKLPTRISESKKSITIVFVLKSSATCLFSGGVL